MTLIQHLYNQVFSVPLLFICHVRDFNLNYCVWSPATFVSSCSIASSAATIGPINANETDSECPEHEESFDV